MKTVKQFVAHRGFFRIQVTKEIGHKKEEKMEKIVKQVEEEREREKEKEIQAPGSLLEEKRAGEEIDSLLKRFSELEARSKQLEEENERLKREKKELESKLNPN